MVRKLCLPEALEAIAQRFDVPREGVVDFAQIGWVQVSADLSEEQAVALALASTRVQGYLEDDEPRRVIARPPKIVNVVV